MTKKSLFRTIITGAAIIVAVALLAAMRSPVSTPEAGVTTETRAHAAPFDFNRDVLESPVPVLVDFWAPWCGPCRIVGPVIEGIAQKTAGKAKVVKINVDNYQDLARRYNIRGIPTVMVFRNGAVEKTLVGVQEESTYLEAIGL